MASEGKFYLPYLMDKIRSLGGNVCQEETVVTGRGKPIDYLCIENG